MISQILADNRHTTTREDIRQDILQRTTRGMLTYNTGKVHRLEGELWAVPSTRGGFHKVDLDQEACDCEDFTFYGSAAGVLRGLGSFATITVGPGPFSSRERTPRPFIHPVTGNECPPESA